MSEFIMKGESQFLITVFHSSRQPPERFSFYNARTIQEVKTAVTDLLEQGVPPSTIAVYEKQRITVALNPTVEVKRNEP